MDCAETHIKRDKLHSILKRGCKITDRCQLKKTSRMTLDAADKLLLIMLATCHNIVCYVSEINVPAIMH